MLVLDGRLLSWGGTDKIFRQVTFGALPDDVVLHIFNLYVDAAVEYEAPDA